MALSQMDLHVGASGEPLATNITLVIPDLEANSSPMLPEVLFCLGCPAPEHLVALRTHIPAFSFG